MTWKFSPQGILMLAPRIISGGLSKPGAFVATGCADDLDMALAQTEWKHQETCSGQRATDATGVSEQSLTISGGLTDFSPNNISLALNGTITAAAVTTTAVTNEAFPAGLIVGDIIQLGATSPADNITSATIVDSNGTPATLAAGTDYTLDAATGAVTILNLGAYTQPFKANYTRQNSQKISIFTAAQVERWARFAAVDTQNGNRKSMIHLYRIKVKPTSSFPLLAKELAVLPFSAEALVDDSKPIDPVLGQFGFMTTPSAP